MTSSGELTCKNLFVSEIDLHTLCVCLWSGWILSYTGCQTCVSKTSAAPYTHAWCMQVFPFTCECMQMIFMYFCMVLALKLNDVWQVVGQISWEIVVSDKLFCLWKYWEKRVGRTESSRWNLEKIKPVWLLVSLSHVCNPHYLYEK